MLSLAEHLKIESDKYVALTLEKTKGNREQACSLLGVSIATLYRIMPTGLPDYGRTPNGVPRVYLVESNGVYKIGYSSDVDNRIGKFKTSNPHIVLVKCWNAVRRHEKHLHSLFVSKRISGEWYRLDERDIDMIYAYFKDSSRL